MGREEYAHTYVCADARLPTPEDGLVPPGSHTMCNRWHPLLPQLATDGAPRGTVTAATWRTAEPRLQERERQPRVAHCTS